MLDCATIGEDLVILWPEIFGGDVFCRDGARLFKDVLFLEGLCAATGEDLVFLWPEVFGGDVDCGDGAGLFKDVLFLEGLCEEELFELGFAF